MLTVGSMVHYALDGVCCVIGTVEKKYDGILPSEIRKQEKTK